PLLADAPQSTTEPPHPPPPQEVAPSSGYDIPSTPPQSDVFFGPDALTLSDVPPSPVDSPPPPPLNPSPPLQSSIDSLSDLLFLVDASGSMNSAWRRHLKCVSTIARIAVGKAKIGVIVYSSKNKHRLRIPFTQYSDATMLDSMINALPFHGGVTNTGEALFEAVRVLEKERPQRVNVITITDGYSWDSLDEGSARIRSFSGSTTFALSLDEPFVRKELEILAGSSDCVFTQSDGCERLTQTISRGRESEST
ncbi:hypothetical protein PFISCL1PPCAC_28785, partial [Pristionchus fissidentatus]